MKKTAIIIYIIGGLAMIASIIGWISGDRFLDQLLNLTISVSLIGTAWMYQKGKIQ